MSYPMFEKARLLAGTYEKFAGGEMVTIDENAICIGLYDASRGTFKGMFFFQGLEVLAHRENLELL